VIKLALIYCLPSQALALSKKRHEKRSIELAQTARNAELEM
jgi:hypothetical protein